MEIAKKTIVNLIVLGQLEKGKKINCKGKTFVVDDYTRFQGIFRFLRNDDRTSTLDKIEILVNDVKILHDHYKLEYDNGNEENLCNLKHYIEQGLCGLEKLRETYSDDKTTWASLGFEIEKLKRIKNMIPEFVNSNFNHNFVQDSNLYHTSTNTTNTASNANDSINNAISTNDENEENEENEEENTYTYMKSMKSIGNTLSGIKSNIFTVKLKDKEEEIEKEEKEEIENNSDS